MAVDVARVRIFERHSSQKLAAHMNTGLGNMDVPEDDGGEMVARRPGLPGPCCLHVYDMMAVT